MSEIGKFFGRPKDVAKDKIQDTVRKRYFPEMWYMLENWFALTKSKSILDLGCGNGLITEALAKSGWEVTATDPSLDCLLATQERFQQAGLEARFEQAELESLPFATHSFDSIVCMNLLEFTESPRRAMRELYRVLRPGGKAMIVTFAKMSPWGISGIARAVRKEVKPRNANFLGKKDFVRLLQSSKLKIERLKGRARYLPATSGKMTLPVNGAYVAFVSKPEGKEKGQQETDVKNKNHKVEKD